MTQDYKEKYPIGSQWKCRDGSRAVVVGYNDGEFETIVWNENENNAEPHNEKGEFWSHDGEDYTSYDLIEPWQETRTFEGWVIVYTDGDFGGVWGSKFAAQEFARDIEKLATIHLTYNEQDGVTATVEE